jgi:hypothetical protein
MFYLYNVFHLYHRKSLTGLSHLGRADLPYGVCFTAASNGARVWLPSRFDVYLKLGLFPVHIRCLSPPLHHIHMACAWKV